MWEYILYTRTPRTNNILVLEPVVFCRCTEFRTSARIIDNEVVTWNSVGIFCDVENIKCMRDDGRLPIYTCIE